MCELNVSQRTNARSKHINCVTDVWRTVGLSYSLNHPKHLLGNDLMLTFNPLHVILIKTSQIKARDLICSDAWSNWYSDRSQKSCYISREHLNAAPQPVPPSIHLLRGALSPAAARWRAHQWWLSSMNTRLCSVGGTWSCAWVICVAVCRFGPRSGGTERSSASTVRASSSCTEQVSCPTL